MPITQRLKPNTLFRPRGFSHAVVTEGTRAVYTSGQIATDLDGNIQFPGDHERQSEIAFRNFAHAIESSGASLDDVVRINFYVVDFTAETNERVMAGFAAASTALGFRVPTIILLGVTRLGVDGAMIEIDGHAHF